MAALNRRAWLWTTVTIPRWLWWVNVLNAVLLLTYSVPRLIKSVFP